MSDRQTLVRSVASVFEVPQLRAAFSGLGHAAALLVFVIAATALKLTANRFPNESSAAGLSSFAWEAVALGAALLIPVPVIVAACNLAPRAGLRRLAWLVAGTGVAIVACLASPLPRLLAGITMNPGAEIQLTILLLLFAVVLEFRQRALATAGALMRVEIDGVTADARLRDASLRVLQAQIAPHFLFNTLANVRRLSRIDRGAAAAMLGDLVHYFSVTLSRRDAPKSRLGEEALLVDAYLRIHRVRMGARLQYEVRVPPDLAPAQVPSMMLLTLVENAVKHGLNPLVEGGFLSVRAERQQDVLHIEVADTGRGMSPGEGHGMGLANIRARLEMLYGSRAALVLEQGRPRGFVASLSLPLEQERVA